MPEFFFLRPYWLLAAPLAISIYLLVGHSITGHPFWHRYLCAPIARLLITSGRSKKWAAVFFSLIWAIISVAAAGPGWERKKLPIDKSGDAMIILLDLSLSMLAVDVAPTRIERTRYRIIDILNERQDGQAALIVYAGSAHVVSPLTEDVTTIINQLQVLSPTIMPKLGASPEEAFKLLESMRDSIVGGGKVLWFTDEASSEEIAEAHRSISQLGLRLVLIPVGTAEGAPVSLPGGFLTGVNGEVVHATVPLEHMHESAVTVGVDYLPFDRLSNRMIAQLVSDTGAFAPQHQRTALSELEVDSGYWLLPLALLLLLPLFRRGLLVAVSLLIIAPLADAGWWQRDDQIGHSAFELHDYERAEKHFERPDWRAASLYRQKKYAAAEKIWTRLGDWYNAGNALAQQGRIARAIAAYEKQLELEPQHESARHNLELLQQLQQQQQNGQGDQKRQDQQPQSGGAGEDEQTAQDGENEQQRPDGEEGEQAQDGEKERQDEQQQPSGEGDELSSREGADENTAQEGEGDQRGDEDDEENAESASQDAAEGDPEEEAEGKHAQQQEAASERESLQLYQQWLRKIPDDPALLLKRKFEHQYNLRRHRGDWQSDNGKTW